MWLGELLVSAIRVQERLLDLRRSRIPQCRRLRQRLYGEQLRRWPSLWRVSMARRPILEVVQKLARVVR